MLYFVINIILSAFLLWFSSYTDASVKDETEGLDFVRIIMILAAGVFLFSIGILTTLYENVRLTEFIGRVVIFLYSLFSVQLFSMLLFFPKPAKNKALIAVKVIVLIFTAYISAFGINSYDTSIESGIIITGKPVSIGEFSTDWFRLYLLLFMLVLPAINILQMFIRAIKTKAKLQKQRIAFAVLSLLCGLLFIVILYRAVKVVPAYALFYPIILSIVVALLYNAQRLPSLIDIRMFGINVFRFFYAYFIEAICVAFSLTLLLPFIQKNPIFFGIAAVLIIILSFLMADGIAKLLHRKNHVRDNDYEKQFEGQITSLDYDKSSEEITAELVSIFEKNLDTSFVDVLIETQDGKKLSTVYSSLQHNTEIDLSNPIFDVLLNAKRTILFRGHELTVHALSPIQRELTRFFNESGADAIIILCEGRHVFGMLLLGPKRLQNVFTNYDYSVFTKLYSSLFVVGYYMKNIANESIVGTVAREISMSGQIIESIQGNMDLINNPKVDVGYLSMAARTLGGNFVDFIRLTDKRYIIVMGNVSGKGINASMCMVILKSIIRTFLTETKDFKELIQKVNYFIRYNLPKGTFFAGVFALVDFEDNTMYYINCGVPALFMYTQAYNNVIEIQGDGRVLGFVPDVTKLVKVKRVKLNPGDIIITCNEGLFASQSLRGDYFSKDMVQHLIIENLSYPAERMAQFVHQSLLDFTSKELENDISIIVLKYLQKQTSEE